MSISSQEGIAEEKPQNLSTDFPPVVGCFCACTHTGQRNKETTKQHLRAEGQRRKFNSYLVLGRKRLMPKAGKVEGPVRLYVKM